RVAKDSDVYVIAMDNHKKKNRDKFMASRIPSDGNTLVYVGQAHLMEDNIPEYFKHGTGIQIYRVSQVLSQKSKDDITTWLDSLAEQSDVLKQGDGFALNLKKHGLHHVVDRHVSTSLLGSGSQARHFDGLLYHR
ncbi:MAG: hypothetical protein QGH19_02770, partial [Candidatus Woesearchaeota archaeon]|nr:hypothetical protein [Candidatus Woesearchaeota archaeon]